MVSARARTPKNGFSFSSHTRAAAILSTAPADAAAGESALSGIATEAQDVDQRLCALGAEDGFESSLRRRGRPGQRGIDRPHRDFFGDGAQSHDDARGQLAIVLRGRGETRETAGTEKVNELRIARHPRLTT